MALMDQRWLQRVNKLLPALKAGDAKEKNWCFDYIAAAKKFNCTRQFGTQRHDHVANASQWSQHRSGARVQNSAQKCRDDHRLTNARLGTLCLTCSVDLAS